MDRSQIKERLTQIQYQQRLDEFQEKRKLLSSQIQLKKTQTKNKGELELIECFEKMSDYDTETYEEKYWLWNNGCYRSEEEILNHELEKDDLDYEKYEGNKNEYKNYPYIAFPIWLIICLLIIHNMEDYNKFVGGFMLLIFTSPIPFILFLILNMIFSAKKMKELDKHRCHNELYQKEKTNFYMSVLGLTGSALSTYRHIKESTKYVTTPSQWKEFK